MMTHMSTTATVHQLVDRRRSHEHLREHQRPPAHGCP